MPRLTAELIGESPQFTNPVRDWELDLRGLSRLSRASNASQSPSLLEERNKIAVIENLGATLDQFDTIDFSDNEIRKLDGFPLLSRLKNIVINNNRVCRIAEALQLSIPKLESLVVTNNNIEDLSDLDPLASVTTLTYLTLLRNPVVHKPGYRYYVISLLPNLRVLDFKRIRMKEREKAKELYGERDLAARPSPAKAKTFTPGEGQPVQIPQAPPPSGPSPVEIAKIRDAIAAAKSLEEVHQLEALLKAGQLPVEPGSYVQNGQLVEMDD